MKRIMMVLLMAAVCSDSALAQKGMSGVGVNIPLSTGDGGTALGIGVKYYYNISDYFRIEPSAEYMAIHPGGGKEYDIPLFKGFLNGHIFLASIRPARPYIIAGVGFVSYERNEISEDGVAAIGPGGITYSSQTYYESYTLNDNAFCGNIGLGYDFRLSHSFSMQVEGTGLNCMGEDRGYHPGKWTFLARVGLTYNF
ncbi:MAG: outer membrane beta-barrel protein [Bacteroidaceae bacterium]|nr:outer membrane beta-barrel protein [Bacteroidaceae bacterium]